MESSLHLNTHAETSQKNNRNQSKGAIRKQKKQAKNNQKKNQSEDKDNDFNAVVKQLGDIEFASTSEDIPTATPAKEADEPKLEQEQEQEDCNASGMWNQSMLEYAEDQFQCCICTEMIISAVTLNCSHTFCSFCILQWKDRKSYCPVCRVRIRVQLPTKIIDSFIDKLVGNSSPEVQLYRKVVKEEREEKEKTFKANVRCECNSCESSIFEDDDDDDDDFYYEDDSSDSFGGNVVPFYEDPVLGNILSELVYDLGANYEDMLDGASQHPEEAVLVPPGPTTVNGAYFGGYGRCFNCGETGHWRNGCPLRRNCRTFGACFSCGEVGHWANNCPNRH